MNKPSVLIVGIGEVGRYVLEFLARDEAELDIVAADDARVHFMPYAIEIMRDVLGFDCTSFVPEECAELAKEQMARFRALERRHAG